MIKYLPHDKLAHYFVGTLIGLFGVILLPAFIFMAVVMALIIGVGKEIYDNLSGTGTPDSMDVVWTAAGGLVVNVAFILGAYYAN